MTTACDLPSVVTPNNRWLVVMGGFSDKTRLSRVEILDTDSTQWYHAASLPLPLSHALPATIGNVLSCGWLYCGRFIQESVWCVFR